jgi:hypothetical protein
MVSCGGTEEFRTESQLRLLEQILGLHMSESRKIKIIERMAEAPCQWLRSWWSVNTRGKKT